MHILHVFEQGVPQVLLPFTTMPVSPTSTEAHYEVTRFITLSEHLRILRGEEALRNVFGNFKQLLDACLNLKLPLKNLEFDSNLVYYDSWVDTLRFIYLPFEGIDPDVRKIRGFFEGVASLVGNPDAGMSELLNSYTGYIASSMSFNPLEFARFLATVSGPTTQVDWASVQAASSERRADSNTTDLRVTQVDESRIHDRPASADAESAEVGSKGTVPEKGAHARVDPGTTVLEAIAFDFNEKPDETEVLDGLSRQEEAGNEASPEVAAIDEESQSSATLHPPSADVPDASATESALVADGKTKAQTPEPDQIKTAACEPLLPQYWLQRRSTDERVRIVGERFIVGKSKYSTFQVRHTTTVSRNHAIFTCDDEGCWIEDDNSRNGTYLDNRRIEPHVRERLEDGMIIRMSDEEFTFSVIRNV